MVVFYSTAGATARAAAPTPRSGVGAVKLVVRRAPRYRFTARRARTALGCFGRGNADAAYVFLTRAGRVVREMFLICIY